MKTKENIVSKHLCGCATLFALSLLLLTSCLPKSNTPTRPLPKEIPTPMSIDLKAFELTYSHRQNNVVWQLQATLDAQNMQEAQLYNYFNSRGEPERYMMRYKRLSDKSIDAMMFTNLVPEGMLAYHFSVGEVVEKEQQIKVELQQKNMDGMPYEEQTVTVSFDGVGRPVLLEGKDAKETLVWNAEGLLSIVTVEHDKKSLEVHFGYGEATNDPGGLLVHILPAFEIPLNNSLISLYNQLTGKIPTQSKLPATVSISTDGKSVATTVNMVYKWYEGGLLSFAGYEGTPTDEPKEYLFGCSLQYTVK